MDIDLLLLLSVKQCEIVIVFWAPYKSYKVSIKFSFY